jgi:DNA polymerase-4
MFVQAVGTILHADVDSFYASVEQRDDPRLRGRPVIVGAGVVLAASYEAKAHGVRTAMGGRQALRLCPDAVVVPPRMSAYSEASKAMFRVFEDATPLVEGLSIDEAFLDVRGLERISGTPTEITVPRARRPPRHGRGRADEVPREGRERRC